MLGVRRTDSHLENSISPSLLWGIALVEFDLPQHSQCHEDPAKAKRKKSPHRSISQPRDQVDKIFQRIVTLDVYSAFQDNPAKLLNGTAQLKKENLDPNCELKIMSTKIAKKSIAAIQSGCRTLPTFIANKEQLEFDISGYQNTQGASSVNWKGAQPLHITPEMPSFFNITVEEAKTCATLRIMPAAYLEIKRTLLAAVSYYGPFKKREAQTWFRIDVNKICIIYDWFKTLGWIPSSDDWAVTSDQSKRGLNSEVSKSKKFKRR